ncbi:MAG: glycosyltransferase family 2 protein [Sphingobacteriales bacterium]|nr:glycosyltransferase family 2 protein [Sphingobacteriales bacterium]
MQSLSVVIICKNEADIIGNTLLSLQGLTDDIVVYDNGSTDNTLEEINKFNVHLQQGSWEGFGKTKNNATALAKHEWILSLDADEAISKGLKNELMQWQPDNEKTVYKLPFRNFIGNKMLKHGDWGTDYHVRLYNRKVVQWNEADVHEELILPADVVIKELKNFVLHRTWRNADDYKNKMQNYALLGAEKYFKQGKRAGWFKRNFSPSFSFIRSYVLKLGFFDGKAGYQCAKMIAGYTKMKYQKLAGLLKEKKRE